MVVNVGHSRVGIGVFVAGELEYIKRVPIEHRGDWEGAFREAWSRIADRERPAIAGASVNAPLIEAVEHAVSQATSREVEWIGPDIAIPMKVKTDEPAKTGIDRVLTLAAAYEQLGKACVVVDAGTAITVNCCNDAGEFIGGAIAPGVRMMLDALHERTSSLPQLKFARPSQAVGTSTQQAILNGVFHSIRGLVQQMVESYATELGSWPELIATGGDAHELFDDWELVHAVSADLLLYGIALAYTEHYSKQAS